MLALAKPQPVDDVGELWAAAMRRGDFEAAWRQTDRIELPRRLAERERTLRWDRHRHLVWNGSPLEGRILVQCEHGLGDTIQFVRYLRLLRERATHITLRVQPALLDLLHGMEGVDELQDAWGAAPPLEHDVAIECMEFSYAFRHTARTLPSEVPYLPMDRIAAGAGRLPPLDPGVRHVGLIWSASDWDPSRSVALSQLAPLGGVEGVVFHSLQQGEAQNEALNTCFLISDLARHTGAVRDAAVAMLQLDLIITVDSMTAHLAGALGRPTWLLLQHTADWRWMDGVDRSPWYPTVRIFRQPTPGDWATPIRAMAEQLCSIQSASKPL